MATWITALLGFAGVVLGVSVTYFIARRTTSGNISTSDAASLWKESNDLRKEYRERAESLEKQLEIVNSKLQSVMDALGNLRAYSANMVVKIEALKAELEELREENKRLLALKEQVK